MGYRLSKIYTRTGDNGTTGISGTQRVPKDDPRINIIGSVDELNSFIGLILSEELPDPARETLIEIQHRLFDLGGELSMPGHVVLQQTSVDVLEAELDRMNDELDPLENFILPGGSRAASICHIARSVARRAERGIVTLQNKEDVSPVLCAYLNRLSDLLFVMARSLNKHAGQADVLWQQKKLD
ncbi:MAG TPA: cob(I)yrinic acid a,c-diamide adenosyltransferase [Gammaproteobacteria bacterium]|nr:cob(I)yrinic acid a,c-diamide adenosyltransferase [Gammaproteobacteria bacterium]